MVKQQIEIVGQQREVTRIQPDVLLALESRIADISKTMCENKTILAYEKIRQLGEFIAYERAKHSAQ
jgi:hypothetical protein